MTKLHSNVSPIGLVCIHVLYHQQVGLGAVHSPAHVDCARGARGRCAGDAAAGCRQAPDSAGELRVASAMCGWVVWPDTSVTGKVGHGCRCTRGWVIASLQCWYGVQHPGADSHDRSGYQQQLSHCSMCSNQPCVVCLQATKHRELPAWVTFPDCERVEWINAMLAQLWPHASSAIVAQASCMQGCTVSTGTQSPTCLQQRTCTADGGAAHFWFGMAIMAGVCRMYGQPILLAKLEGLLTVSWLAGARAAGPADQGGQAQLDWRHLANRVSTWCSASC